MNNGRVFGLAALLLCGASGAANAALTLQASYGLGEAGTVGSTAPFTPLYDSTGNGHNITGTTASSTNSSIETSSIAAPGSTAALQLNNASGSTGAWFYNAVPLNLTNNFAFEIYVRPDSTAGTLVLDTDNNTSSGTSVTSGISLWAHNTTTAGASSGLGFGTGGNGVQSPTAGISYSAGNWYRVDVIRYNGSNYLYIGAAGNQETLVATTTDAATLSQPILGAGQSVAYATSAAFDSMNIYTFDSSSDSLQSVTDGLGVTPEPTTFAMASIVGLGLLGHRRRAR